MQLTDWRPQIVEKLAHTGRRIDGRPGAAGQRRDVTGMIQVTVRNKDYVRPQLGKERLPSAGQTEWVDAHFKLPKGELKASGSQPPDRCLASARASCCRSYHATTPPGSGM
jgi:hypothetical protein